MFVVNLMAKQERGVCEGLQDRWDLGGGWK